METFVDDRFSWGIYKTTLSIKIDDKVTSTLVNEGLSLYQASKTHFLGLRSKLKCIGAIVFQINYEKNILEKRWSYCDVMQEIITS